MSTPPPDQHPPTTIREDTALRHRRKYENRNPIHVLTLKRFFDHVSAEVARLRPRNTLEFGCGEGYFLEQLLHRDIQVSEYLGIDLREPALAEARQRCPGHRFQCQDLLEWDHADGSYDLVIGSQCLEHLYEPELFLKHMARLSRGHLLLTVPFEPWFRLMNLLRGRDIKRWGNHSEHVQQWGLASFKRFVEPYVTVEKAYVIFPFIVVVGRPVTAPSSRP